MRLFDLLLGRQVLYLLHSNQSINQKLVKAINQSVSQSVSQSVIILPSLQPHLVQLQLILPKLTTVAYLTLSYLVLTEYACTCSLTTQCLNSVTLLFYPGTG